MVTEFCCALLLESSVVKQASLRRVDGVIFQCCVFLQEETTGQAVLASVTHSERFGRSVLSLFLSTVTSAPPYFSHSWNIQERRKLGVFYTWKFVL